MRTVVCYYPVVGSKFYEYRFFDSRELLVSFVYGEYQNGRYEKIEVFNVLEDKLKGEYAPIDVAGSQILSVYTQLDFYDSKK